MRVASEKMISRLSGEGFLPLRLIEPIWGFNKKPIPSTVTKALRTEVKSAIYVNSADDVVCFYCEGNVDGSVVFRMKFFNSETRALFEADYVCEKRRIGKEYRVKLRKKEDGGAALIFSSWFWRRCSPSPRRPGGWGPASSVRR